MLKEDYVSYEVAKLLKEKGFPQEYDVYHSMVYNEEDYEDEYEIQRMVLETKLVKAGTLSSYPIGVPEPKCYCPTHQMAMKWLREVHNLCIAPYAAAYRYGFTIDKCDTGSNICNDRVINGILTTYEQAVETALKYCLTELI